MSIPAKYNITHYQGDTFITAIALEGNLTTTTPKFEIKLPNATSATLELLSGSGITIQAYDAASDTTTFAIAISAAQSTTLGYADVYWYDFEILSGSVVTTYLAGSFTQPQQVSV